MELLLNVLNICYSLTVLPFYLLLFSCAELFSSVSRLHTNQFLKEDVIVQTQLVSPDIKVVESIEEIIDQIEQWYKAIEKK